ARTSGLEAVDADEAGARGPQGGVAGGDHVLALVDVAGTAGPEARVRSAEIVGADYREEEVPRRWARKALGEGLDLLRLADLHDAVGGFAVRLLVRLDAVARALAEGAIGGHRDRDH